MPIYEYQCEACGNKHELIQKISDAPLVECPSCGQPKLKKLVSAAGFRLSGSGWYETDFKGNRKRNLAEKDSKDTKKTEEKSNSKETAKSKDVGKSSSNAKSSTSGQPAASGN